MAKQRFSYKVSIESVTFDVRGNVDLDGLPDIDTVEVEDSIINLWPAFSEYSFGDTFYDATKHLLAYDLIAEADELAATGGMGYDAVMEERRTA